MQNVWSVEVTRASSRNSYLKVHNYPDHPPYEQKPYQGDYCFSRHQNYNFPTNAFFTGFKGSSNSIFKQIKCQPVIKFNPPPLLPCHHAHELGVIVVDQLLPHVGGELHGVGGVDGSVSQKPRCHSGGEAAFVQCHHLTQNHTSWSRAVTQVVESK